MSRPPELLSEPPDLLSAALLRDASYKAVDARAPWGVHVPARPRAAFYAIVHGSARLEVEGAPVSALAVDDVGFVAPGVAHTLRDASTSQPIAACEPGQCDVASPARLGGTGASTLFVSGWFELSRTAGFAERVAVVRASAQAAALIGVLRAELAAPRPATELLLRRLGDVLLVETLRAAPAAASRSLSHPAVLRAVELLHGALAAAWSVEELARRVGMSRSTFATVFVHVMGEPPLRYLARARLARAAQLLRETGASVADIAARVGYDDAPSFSKAFKRVRGTAPAAYRSSSARST